MIALSVTDEQRAGLAVLLSSNWSGPEAALVALLELYEQLDLEDYCSRVGLDARGVPFTFTPPDGFDPHALRRVDLSKEAIAALLAHYPQAPTPARLGPAKARLIRAARAALEDASATGKVT